MLGLIEPNQPADAGKTVFAAQASRSVQADVQRSTNRAIEARLSVAQQMVRFGGRTCGEVCRPEQVRAIPA
jgi:hypothetical protein